MANQSGNAYGLTTLCPIINGSRDDQSYSALVRYRLQQLHTEDSEISRVPNTYLCRLFVLNDVFYQGKPAALDHLKSKYLVFTSNFHGELEPYLRGMWDAAGQTVREVWEFCVGFERVHDAPGFVDYIKKCQVKTTFYFNGSTDDSLAEQLKALYLKQELSIFAYENQAKSPKDLQRAFNEFVKRVKPSNLAAPTWKAGASSLDSVVIEEDSRNTGSA